MRLGSALMMRSPAGSVAFLALAACALPVAAQSQEVGLAGTMAQTGYEDLEWPVGITGRVGLPWLGLEVAAGWSRDGPTSRSACSENFESVSREARGEGGRHPARSGWGARAVIALLNEAALQVLIDPDMDLDAYGTMVERLVENMTGAL